MMLGAIAIVALAAAYMMFTRGGEPTSAPAAVPAISATTGQAGVTVAVPEEYDGPVITLASITVNLADRKFLRLGLALQLAESEEGEQPTEEDPRSFGARALDSAIEVMSGYSSQDLATAEGRSAAKQKLAEAVVSRYGGEVVAIYFTDFVMQ